MSRKRKHKVRNLSKNKSSGIQFEEVENANDILQAYMDEVEPKISFGEPYEDSKNQTRNSKKREPEKTKTISIDLHHLTLEEAISKTDQTIQIQSRNTGKVAFQIITGKGRHSGPQGPVLPSGIHDHVRAKYKNQIFHLDPCPTDNLINGLPLKGYFRVILIF